MEPVPHPRSSATRLLVVLVTAVLLALIAAPARAADTSHVGTYWSWTGPQRWTFSEGVYGITVSGDNGAVLDRGFSTVVCSPGTTWPESVAASFKARRQALRAQGFTLTKVYPVQRLGSADYRRQRVDVTTRSAGRSYRGLVQLDYDSSASVAGVDYCFQQTEARLSLSSAWTNKSRQLATVRATLTYLGPAVPQTP